jgi:hypothetical protein
VSRSLNQRLTKVEAGSGSAVLVVYSDAEADRLEALHPKALIVVVRRFAQEEVTDVPRD